MAEQINARVLLVLPSIFHEYIAAFRKHRYALFSSGSGSGQSQDATLQKPVRDAVMKGFLAAYAILRDGGEGEEVWDAMVELARVLEQAAIVDLRDVEHANAVREIVSHAVEGLAASATDGRYKSLDLISERF